MITTVPDLLWQLRSGNKTLDEQKDALRHFVSLPVWECAPAELVKEVTEFLGGILSMNAAGADDEARDDHGRWTSSGGGDGVYASPIVAVSEDAPVTDTAVRDAVESVAISNAGGTYDANQTTQTMLDGAASPTKAAVVASIADKLDRKYDTQLLGTSGGTPVTSLLTNNDVWLRDVGYDGKQNNYNYFGKKDDYFRDTDSTRSKFLDDDTKSGRLKFGDDPTLLDNLRQANVSLLVSGWAGTSNDSSVQSLAMQDSAIKEFGLKDTQGWKTIVSDSVKTELDKNGDMYQAFLRAQYDSTQQFFKENKITDVTAYRGFDFTGTSDDNLPDWAKGPMSSDSAYHGKGDIPLRPLSSFSYSWTTAHPFAGYGGNGLLISGKIPVARILSTAVTGLGCLGERELVVLGGKDEWTISQ